MTSQTALVLLEGVEALIINSHVVYTSGRHGTAYVNKDAVYPHTIDTFFLCAEIASYFAHDNVEVVVAPAVGGVILSQWTAHHLTSLCDREVLGVYAEKEVVAISDSEGLDRKCYAETGNFVIKRGYDKLVSGKNVLVVEDVLTTGGTAKKVIEAVRAIGGNVVGLGALCNRGGITPDNVADVPKLVALVEALLDSWNEEDCPMCKEGIPINTDVGKGREFLARKSTT